MTIGADSSEQTTEQSASQRKNDYSYASLLAAVSRSSSTQQQLQTTTASSDRSSDMAPPTSLRSSFRNSAALTQPRISARQLNFTSDTAAAGDAVSQRSLASSTLGGTTRAHQLQALTETLTGGEGTPLLFRDAAGPHGGSNSAPGNSGLSLFPGIWEDEDEDYSNPEWTPYYHGLKNKPHRFTRRSFRRRVFLFVSEPRTSIGSATFFVVLILVIAASNIIMIMQTMDYWQFVPDDCESCGGPTYYLFEDDAFEPTSGVPCQCPPAPLHSIVQCEDWVVYYMTVEWSIRVLAYEPSPAQRSNTFGGRICQWFSFLTHYTTIMDGLAIFPYYAERFEKSNGLMSLRLLRLFRVFQLVRLGAYNTTFLCLTNVLSKSLVYLRLLVVVLLFGAAFFGSIVYWLEKGTWKWHEKSQSYQFLRIAEDGVTEEPSPFSSIPQAFWWFLVTATTVGYGDTFPTSTPGKWVAALAMIMGVLVIAFPVSVFSDLWSRELRRSGIAYEEDEDEDEEDAYERLDTFHLPEKEAIMDGAIAKNGAPGLVSKKYSNEMLEFSEEIDNRTIEMTRNDAKKIAKHVRLIDRSQARIRDILAKYDIET